MLVWSLWDGWILHIRNCTAEQNANWDECFPAFLMVIDGIKYSKAFFFLLMHKQTKLKLNLQKKTYDFFIVTFISFFFEEYLKWRSHRKSQCFFANVVLVCFSPQTYGHIYHVGIFFPFVLVAFVPILWHREWCSRYLCKRICYIFVVCSVYCAEVKVFLLPMIVCCGKFIALASGVIGNTKFGIVVSSGSSTT